MVAMVLSLNCHPNLVEHLHQAEPPLEEHQHLVVLQVQPEVHYQDKVQHKQNKYIINLILVGK
jgi:hypothetical protein